MQLACAVRAQPCDVLFHGSSSAECLGCLSSQMFFVACLPDGNVRYFPRICEKLHLTCQVHKNTRAYYIFGGKNERDAGLGIGVVCGEDSCLGSHFPAYLSYADCRWPKADPERNHFSACVHASLPQATHPEGKAPTCLPAPEPLPLTPSWLLICGGGNMEIVQPAQFIHSTPGNVCIWIKISCAETNLMESLVRRAVMNK